MIRLFLVDDHLAVRVGLRALLTTQADLDLRVVGEASNGLELLAQLPTTPADVVLLDFNMPGMNGLETARQLKEHYPGVRILALSMLAEEQYIIDMLAAGAHGYVLKSGSSVEIVQGVQAVAAGQAFLGTAAGLVALHKLPASQEPAPAAAPAGVTLLSKREHEVLQLIAQGLTTSEMAEKLFTSKRTVETHRQNILAKTQMKNTAALIRFAMQQRLID
ncbi:MAG: response regulator [Janthinobacterium lividum]